MATNSPPQSPGFVWRLVHLEPVLWKSLAVATFALLASFGVMVRPELSDNLVGFIVALAAIVQVLWVRSSVVPEEKVVLYAEDPVNGRALRAGPAVPAPSIPDVDVERLVNRKG